MKKLIIASTTALLISVTPSYAGTMGDIGDTIGDLTSDLQFGAGIGITNTSNLSRTFLLYGIAEKTLDIDIPDITSVAQVRIGTGTNSDIQGLPAGVTGSGGIDFLISGLYQGSMEVEDFNVYALAGLTYSALSSSVTNAGTTTNKSSTSTDFTFGLGAKYELERDLIVAVEYQKIDTTSVFGVNAYFDF